MTEILSSFWKTGESREQLRLLLDKGSFADAALRLSDEPRQLADDVVHELFRKRRWGDLDRLIAGFGGMRLLEREGISHAILSTLSGLPMLIEKLLVPHKKSETAVTDIRKVQETLYGLLEWTPGDKSLLAIVDRCEERYRACLGDMRKIAASGDLNGLRFLLGNLTFPGVGTEHERHWKDLLDKDPALEIPASVTAKYTDNLPARIAEMADALLAGGPPPPGYSLRRDIFRHLFGRHYLGRGNAGGASGLFERASREASAEMKGLEMQCLNDKEDPHAKLEKLWRMQCLSSPDPMCDACSSFFELRLAQRAEGDDRTRHLIQAEMQLPKAADMRRFRKEIYDELTGVSQRLLEGISRMRAEHLLGEGRMESAIPYLVQAERRGFSWAWASIAANQDAILASLGRKDGADAFAFLLRAMRTPELGRDLAPAIRRAAADFAGRGREAARSGSGRLDMSALVSLYRALHLGVPFAELSGELELCRKRFREDAQADVDQLATKVGDTLGEAISKSSVVTIPAKGEGRATDIGNQLERLYERFKDVLTQQDPYLKDSKKSLGEILQEAERLIQEAESISSSKTCSVYQRIVASPKNAINSLLFEGDESVLSAVSQRYLHDNNYLEKTLNTGETKRVLPEHIVMRNYAKILVEMVITEISLHNNPLLMQLGKELDNFLNFGQMTLGWWSGSEDSSKAEEVFGDREIPREPIVLSDRFVISHIVDWLRFENEEALKVPYRKGMSVVCTHITSAMASCRREADRLFNELLVEADCASRPELPNLLAQLRKSMYQISSMEALKNLGTVPQGLSRSLEPRVRSFVEGLVEQLATYDIKTVRTVRGRMPEIEELDRNEFRLGLLLKDKERLLKKYLYGNLSDLTRSYLSDTQRGSIAIRIEELCLRVQQGIYTRRNEMRNIRYCAVLTGEAGEMQTPSFIRDAISLFEENFPIIDRITGSRQRLDSAILSFDVDKDGKDRKGLRSYMSRVDQYLDNAQKMARQLRIIIIPGVGNGSFEPISNSLCIPLRPPVSVPREYSLLTALADFLYCIKFINEGSESEEGLLELVNKKSSSAIKAGSHDAKMKITELIHREISCLCGVKGTAPNAAAISTLLIQSIIGSDNTMIYREIRNLSAPQKQERFDELKEKYKCMRRGVPIEEGILDIVFPIQRKEGGTAERKEASLYRSFVNLPEIDQYTIKEELYDLAVFLFHYGKFDQSYQLFQVITKLDPDFPEAFWGFGTVARSQAVTVAKPSDRELAAISAFRSFIAFDSVGVFWRKRASDILKKLVAL